jgi:hypothetical protein
MRTRTLIASIASMVVCLAGSAQAASETIAGWDFSQYMGDGSFVKDLSLVPSNTLDANYSNRAAAPGAGPPAAPFGTAYFDGSNGSTSVNPNAVSPALVPTAALRNGSLHSNLRAPGIKGYADFDSKTGVKGAGQPLFNRLSMTAPAAVDAVFKADLGAPPPASHHWELSLGGRTFSGSSSLDVEFSSDGISYSPMATFNLTSTDTAFKAPLVAAVGNTAYVRLGLNPAGGQPIVDNVAVMLVPEPGAFVQAAGSLLTLALCHGIASRRRRRC